MKTTIFPLSTCFWISNVSITIFLIDKLSDSTPRADPEHDIKHKSSGKHQLSCSIFSHFITETASNASSGDD